MNEKRNFQREVEKKAYDLYVQRGMIEGQDLDDWFQAEKIVAAENAKSRQSKTETTTTLKGKGRSLK